MNNLKFDLILIQIHEPGTDVIMRLLKPCKMRLLSYRHGDDRAMMLTFKTRWNLYRRDFYQQTSFGPSNKNISFLEQF